jgi:hypothetical protein
MARLFGDERQDNQPQHAIFEKTAAALEWPPMTVAKAAFPVLMKKRMAEAAPSRELVAIMPAMLTSFSGSSKHRYSPIVFRYVLDISFSVAIARFRYIFFISFSQKAKRARSALLEPTGMFRFTGDAGVDNECGSRARKLSSVGNSGQGCEA